MEVVGLYPARRSPTKHHTDRQTDTCIEYLEFTPQHDARVWSTLYTNYSVVYVSHHADSARDHEVSLLVERGNVIDSRQCAQRVMHVSHQSIAFTFSDEHVSARTTGKLRGIPSRSQSQRQTCPKSSSSALTTRFDSDRAH